jgi:ribosomal protein S18 acetylase RimI-like enzyme
MPQYTIRPAALRDAKAIADLHARVSDDIYQALLPPAAFKPQSLIEGLAFWRDAIEYGEPQMLVALDAEKIIGFVGFDRSRDKGTKPTMGEIWFIVVSPSHWHSGAGLALWDAAREGLQDEGCTQVTIWLPLGNERALRFHDLAGFKRELSSARTVDVNGFRLEEIRLKRSTS